MIFLFAALISILIVVVFLLGYPLLIFVLKRTRQKPWKTEEIIPPVSVIIPSHGSMLLGQKIKNTMVEYPREKMQIIVVYSGTDQNVLKELRSFQDQGLVTFVEEAQRTGKTNAINIGLKRTVQEICVMTDSDTTLENGALAKLVSPFFDETVGAVSGELIYVGNSPQQKSHGLLFNNYKKTLKNWESQIDSCSYAPGELLAFRRKLIDSLPEDVVVDDYYILLRTRREGYRCVSAPEAKVYEKPPSQSAGTRERTRRVVSGTLVEASRFRSMLFNRKYGLFGTVIFPAYVFQLAFLPFFIILAGALLLASLIETALLLPIFWIVVALAVSVSLLAVGRNILRHFSALLIGMILGLTDFLTSKKAVVWKDAKSSSQ